MRNRLSHPARTLSVGFGIAIAVGSLLLLLPGMLRPEVPDHSLLDAVFQATSAVCVTGLCVRQLSEYTFAGQALLLLLIQVGGIGMLTLSKLTLLSAGSHLRLGDRNLIDASLGSVARVSPRDVLRQTVLFTLACELAGALAIAPVFIIDHGWAGGVWAAVFHSISAFCNAGFGLWDDSLAAYRAHPWVNGVIMILIIAGGIGFVVIAELWQRWHLHHRRRLSLHTRTVLIVSGLLIVGGGLIFTIIEVFNPSDDGYGGDGLACAFLAISARTAGFSTAPIDALSHPSLLLLMTLMLIGGSPGSAAGGIKTTTLATLYALVMARARDRQEPELLGRAIGATAVGKALATTACMLGAIAIATLALELTETGLVPHRREIGRLLDHAFEVVSALCTVGLSTGITPELSPGGRVVIIICMFIGRIGPLLIAGSLLGRRRPASYHLPREDLVIG